MSTGTGLPLDKKEIILGATNKSVPALHQSWTKQRGFVAYVAPPVDSGDQGMMGEWTERLQYICTDMHWLLQLSHQQFWCQVIFDDTLHNTLDSFLRYAPRPYDMTFDLTGSSRTLHDQVARLVFFTYLRMATFKESKEHWITASVFGDILYENFLFDIPKMFDLCALYGHSNSALLSKMVTNVFTQQPQYLDDLRAAVPTILQVFTNISVRCGRQESGGCTPQPLELRDQPTMDLVAMGTEEVKDIVLYLADTAVTLTSFLKVFPPACGVLQETQFCSQLAHTYEQLIPSLQSAVRQLNVDSPRQKKMLRDKLHQARLHLLTTFHLIVSHTCLQPVLNIISEQQESTGSIASDYVEKFLGIMSAVLAEKRFLADYEGQFSFHDDMDILSQATDIDATHYSYIGEAINAAFAAHGKRKKPKGNTNTGGRTSPDGSPCPASAHSGSVLAASVSTIQASASRGHMTASTSQAATSGGHTSASGGRESAGAGLAAMGAESRRVAGVELDSLVCCVKDLLPHLGSGFIQLALEELDYSTERVVSAVLEDNLPPALRVVDFTLDSANTAVAVAREEEEVASQTPLFVESRRNVYDNDEFDVFSKPNIDMQRVHKGKKQVEESVLEDKASVRELRPLYDAYGSVDVPSMYDKRMYDDEYDDTYDINNVGADDADSADELTQRRPFTVPQVLRKPERKPQQDESSSDEEEVSRDQFVQDPAKLREQHAQRHASRGHRAPPTRDLKGKPKGQGQTDEVLRNRRFKEANKGARANHNRRAMSDKKQSKGMF